MKSIKLMLAGVSLLLLCGCGTQVQKAVSYTHLTLPTIA